MIRTMHTFTHSLAPIAATLLICPAVADEQKADTHFTIAQDVINLLSETEIVLNSCRDAESVKAAEEPLKVLAKMAQDIKARQFALPDSSLQEDITIAGQVKDFQNLWNAIQNHIERLQRDGLMSDALRDILRIAPTTK